MRYGETDRTTMSRRNRIVLAFFLPGAFLLGLGAIDAFGAPWNDLATGGSVMVLGGILVVWGLTSIRANGNGTKKEKGS